MDSNSPQSYIMNILQNIEGLEKVIKNAEGMNLTEEQKEEFKKQCEKHGVNEKFEEIQKQKELLFKHKA